MATPMELSDEIIVNLQGTWDDHTEDVETRMDLFQIAWEMTSNVMKQALSDNRWSASYQWRTFAGNLRVLVEGLKDKE